MIRGSSGPQATTFWRKSTGSKNSALVNRRPHTHTLQRPPTYLTYLAVDFAIRLHVVAAHHTPRTCRISHHRQPLCSWPLSLSSSYHHLRSLAPGTRPRPFSPSSARTRPHWEGTTSSVCCLRYGTFTSLLPHQPPPSPPPAPPPPPPQSLFARAFPASSKDSHPLIAVELSPICTAFANSNRRRSHSSGNQLPLDLDTFSSLTSSRVASSRPAPTFRSDLFSRTSLLTRHNTTSSHRTTYHDRLLPTNTRSTTSEISGEKRKERSALVALKGNFCACVNFFSGVAPSDQAESTFWVILTVRVDSGNY